MKTITDEFKCHMISIAKDYCIVILKATPKRNEPGVEKIIWEHGRMNFALRADGALSIVCPIADENSLRGVGIFNAKLDKVRKITDEDLAVKAGVFTYEIHACRSFPGDTLPK
jgi:hypothetical protein